MRVMWDGDDVMMARRGRCLLVVFAVCSLPFCSSRFEDVGIFACCFVLACLRSMGTVCGPCGGGGVEGRAAWPIS